MTAPPNTALNEPMYFYGVWLKHLAFLPRSSVTVPQNVIEFGPGNTFAMGVTAILSGARNYVAVEKQNIQSSSVDRYFVRELVQLYRQKVTPTNIDGWPNYESQFRQSRLIESIFADRSQVKSLSPPRIEKIIDALSSDQNSQKPSDPKLVHLQPSRTSLLSSESFDLFFSHSVLEHVKNVKRVYQLASHCLCEGGYFSAQIDLSSHRNTLKQNEQWQYRRLHWLLKNVFNSGRIYPIPQKKHLELMLSFPFDIDLHNFRPPFSCAWLLLSHLYDS